MSEEVKSNEVEGTGFFDVSQYQKLKEEKSTNKNRSRIRNTSPGSLTYKLISFGIGLALGILGLFLMAFVLVVTNSMILSLLSVVMLSAIIIVIAFMIGVKINGILYLLSGHWFMIIGSSVVSMLIGITQM